MLLFCRRGQENLREIKKEYFVIKNRREKIVHELTKNRRDSDEAQNGGITPVTRKKEPSCETFKIFN